VKQCPICGNATRRSNPRRHCVSAADEADIRALKPLADDVFGTPVFASQRARYVVKASGPMQEELYRMMVGFRWAELKRKGEMDPWRKKSSCRRG
jgi:hypothetical protein